MLETGAGDGCWNQPLGTAIGSLPAMILEKPLVAEERHGVCGL